MSANPAAIREKIASRLRNGKTVQDVEEKLPNWAADLIFSLAIQAVDSEDATREAQSLLVVDPDDMIGGSVQAYRVPRRKYIYVGERWTSDLRVRFENAGRLEVTGNGPLQVDLGAANVLHVSERRL